MQQTTPDQNIGRQVEGYVVNAKYDHQLKRQVQSLQRALKDELGETVWLQPADSLHITLMDWLAPLVTYAHPKAQLYQTMYPDYDRELSRILSKHGSISIQFGEIKVSLGAVYIVGHDGGKFNQIRREFLSRITLEEGTKPPPKIVHSTIARFTGEISLQEVETFLAKQSLTHEMSVREFTLVKELKAPMLEYEQIKTYLLE